MSRPGPGQKRTASDTVGPSPLPAVLREGREGPVPGARPTSIVFLRPKLRIALSQSELTVDVSTHASST